MRRRGWAGALALSGVLAACGGGDGGGPAAPSTSTSAAATTTVAGATTSTPGGGPGTTAPPGPTSTSATTAPPATAPPGTAPAAEVLFEFDSAGMRLQATSVVTGLDTVWAMAWGPDGRLWFTERDGRLTRLGDPARRVAGVQASGEAGLMGLEIDGGGRVFVMYTGRRDNRVVEIRPDDSQRVLVSGIAKAAIHDGGRLRFGPDGALYASTGDAGDPSLSRRRESLNGKVLRIDTGSGSTSVFSLGHRNVQGLCLEPGGRFLATEHGPERGDEINVLTMGFDGGWPDRVGDGIKNYTPTIAPAGCALYSDGPIGAWKGSMLFVTLKDASLHRLTFGPDGAVTGDEVLLKDRLGRLRDVAVGPDGAVYLATSNRDGRGSPRAGDDRIVRIAPAP